MIAYKVVEKGTRHCSNVLLFKTGNAHDPERVRDFLRWRRKHPEFFPKYLKGTIVRAVRGSAGIMCFESVRHAEWFISEVYVPRAVREHAKIIKVRGIGPSSTPTEVVSGCGMHPWRLVERYTRLPSLQRQLSPYYSCHRSPPGTIAFKVVEVLE